MELYYKEEYFGDEWIHFVLDITEVEDHYAKYELREVVSWTADNEPIETEEYLDGYIKWDGCSHVNIGDDGYLHLCGADYWKRHCKVMEWVYKEVSKLIERFEEDEVWE